MKLKQLKEKYTKGMRVECIAMSDTQAVPPHTQGTVQFVDDMGTIHIRWDNGQSLGLIPEEDTFNIIQEQQKDYSVSRVSLEVDAPLIRKATLDVQKNIVNTAIKVPYAEYYNLLENPELKRDYIADYVHEMYQDEDGTNHCILVYCDEEPGGILIESEGYNYPRYQGFVNNAHDLLDTHTHASLDPDDRLTKIKVLVVEPHAKPYVAILDNDLESLQAMVGGSIELVSLSDSAELICNEEGKIYDLPANRVVGHDVIAGRFIIVGCDESEHFISLSDNEIQDYSEQFKEPKMIDQSQVHQQHKYTILY